MEKFLKKVLAITQTRYAKIMTEGFMAVAAVTIAGSIFNLLKALPFGFWQTFLASSGLGEILSIPLAVTSNFNSLFIAAAMAYVTAKSFEKDGFSASIIGICAFLILTPLTISYQGVNQAGEVVPMTIDAVSLGNLGSQGMFLAMISGILAARLYVFMIEKNITIRMPDSVPPMVTNMFRDMIPGGIVFLIFVIINRLFSLTPFRTANIFIFAILQAPLVNIGGSVWGVLVMLVLTKLFWWFGIHGGAITMSVFMPIMMSAVTANMQAFAQGITPPYPDWTYAMVICSNIGILALNLWLLTSKSEQFKSIGKISFPTSLFNISEPIMFGLPIMYNPYLFIPFVLSPAVTFLLTKLVLNLGLIKMVTGASANNFLPVFVSMPILNGHWSGFIWALVLIAVNMALYFPFFKAAEAKAVKEEREAAEETA